MKKRITLTQEEINYILCEVNAVLQEEEWRWLKEQVAICKSLKKKLDK